MNLSVQFKKFSNLTTGVDYYKKDPVNIKITQYGVDTMDIEIGPNNSLAHGNSVFGSILLQKNQFEMLFEFTGKIIEFTHNEDLEKSDKIVVKLVQFDSEKWKIFLSKFSKVQKHVNDLFKNIRGD
jgi:hypothetical protein